jgi:cell division protease FtsH
VPDLLLLRRVVADLMYHWTDHNIRVHAFTCVLALQVALLMRRQAERHLYTEGYLLDSLAVRLGGRAAELVVFGQGSTGASNDLAGATALATRMVREFGLSEALGPVGYASQHPQYLGGEEIVTRTYSEETQRVIDQEVSRLLREAEQRALDLLRTHRAALDSLATLLMEKETVDGSTVDDLVRAPTPGEPTAPPTPVPR